MAESATAQSPRCGETDRCLSVRLLIRLSSLTGTIYVHQSRVFFVRFITPFATDATVSFTATTAPSIAATAPSTAASLPFIAATVPSTAAALFTAATVPSTSAASVSVVSPALAQCKTNLCVCVLSARDIDVYHVPAQSMNRAIQGPRFMLASMLPHVLLVHVVPT